MEKGTKRITFQELHDMVAHIDYLIINSYPVIFTVNGKRFACGITGTPGKYYEQQYLAQLCSFGGFNKILDLQDPDCMEYRSIGRMLKRKCGINMDSKIWLNPNSFNGTYWGDEEAYVLKHFWKKNKKS